MGSPAGGVATLVNCTIADNFARGMRYISGTVALTNGIVWGHSTADLDNFGAGELANVAYSLFAEPDTQHGINGCTTNNPLFTGVPPHEYQVQDSPIASPAIDAGFDGLTGWMLGTVDLAGERRRQGASIDMGAYEDIAPAGTLILLR